MNGWRERCKKGRKEEKRRVATGSATGNTQTLQHAIAIVVLLFEILHSSILVMRVNFLKRKNKEE
jgi:hypothetical protein